MNDSSDFDTLAVRAGIHRTAFGEHAEPMFLTSSFVFANAAQAAARFSGGEEGLVYSRFTNPTVQAFCERLAALEGAEACVATASGMSAIMAVVMSLTRAGDHMVSSTGVFGASMQLFNLFGKYGVETTYVPLTDLDAWRAAIRPNTKLLYLESPSNPLTEIADIPALARLANEHGVQLVVDNCFCSPALQRPFELGAHIVVHSATKYIDGQGRVLGGAVLGSKAYAKDGLMPIMRMAGPTLSAFNAWVLLKGLETLSLRMEKQSANALAVATWLATHPRVSRVYYPGLSSHPQHALAMRQQKTGGAIVSFEVQGADAAAQRALAWQTIDHCKLLSITGNLGDTKTTITHPASTTHGRLTPEARAAAGISEGLIRLAVGLESPTDICADLQRGLNQSGTASVSG
ncbi:MAG: O-succinylhomoserine sulfhydrylase [Pseudomonadota bacterium]|jgi:O-succinylhomoserine sulfhydrylase